MLWLREGPWVRISPRLSPQLVRLASRKLRRFPASVFTHCLFPWERTSVERPNLQRRLGRWIRGESPTAASARPRRRDDRGVAHRVDGIGSRWSAAASSAPDHGSLAHHPDRDRATGDDAVRDDSVGAAAAAGSSGADRPGCHAAVRASASATCRRRRVEQRRRRLRGTGERRCTGRGRRRSELRRRQSEPADRCEADSRVSASAGPRLDLPERTEQAATDDARLRAAQTDGRRARRHPGCTELPPHRAVPRPGPPRHQPCPARQPGRTPFAFARHVQDRGAGAPGWPDDLRHAARGRRAREPRRDPSSAGRRRVLASRRVRLGVDGDRHAGRKSSGSS